MASDDKTIVAQNGPVFVCRECGIVWEVGDLYMHGQDCPLYLDQQEMASRLMNIKRELGNIVAMAEDLALAVGEAADPSPETLQSKR